MMHIMSAAEDREEDIFECPYHAGPSLAKPVRGIQLDL